MTEPDRETRRYHCCGTCPGHDHSHHALDCPAPTTSRVERVKHLASLLQGAAYDTTHRLDLLTELIDAAELVRTEYVTRARSEGQSWAKIGACLGISKQGAQQRYGNTA